MPRQVNIQKQDVVNAAYELVRKNGLEGLNARAIAAYLHSSVHPIFQHFEGMKELKEAVLLKIADTFHRYMVAGNDKEKPYKEMGKNYIKFAKDEPKLFKILLMSEANLTPEVFMTNDDTLLENIEKLVGDVTNLNKEEIKEFHIKMWIFTHGIATFIATGTCTFTEEQISSLLTEEFKALLQAAKLK